MVDSRFSIIGGQSLMDFIAPNARILVVDDNKMNLKLTESLLFFFEIQVDCAESGEKALELLQEKLYHLVLMDYMMPVMDGLETTCVIRAMEGTYYRELPIIALTGDDSLQESLFREAGMNDYLLKPVERSLLGAMLRKWLPEELLVGKENNAGTSETEPSYDSEENEFDLPGIDMAEGIRNSGSKEMWIQFLGDFYKLIDVKSTKLEKCMADKRIKEYTIEVHALKNSARIIGAMELSEYFGRMEQLGKAENVEAIEREFPKLLSLYQSYKAILKPYGVREDAERRETTVDEIIFYLRGLQEATEAFDMDSADVAMAHLEELRIPESCNILMEKLRAAVADVAMENILIMTEELISFLRDS